MSARHHLYLSSLFLFTAARAAHADAVADFTAGTAVVVEAATVDPGNGDRTSTGSGLIGKAGGSLDFTLQAADLGVSLPIAVHFQMIRASSARIEYSVAEQYTQPIELGGGHHVLALTGRLSMRVVSLPGHELPAPGNVRLILAAPATVVARTDLGDVPITIASLAVQGGVAQPALAAFRDAGTTPICSDREAATFRTLTVVLTGPARASGAVVSLRRPREAAVGLPPGIMVRAGRDSATVRLRIEPDFVGPVRLTAAVGGVTRPLDLDVRPSGACAH